MADPWADISKQLVQGADVLLGAFIGAGSAAFAAYLAHRRRFKREDQYRDYADRRQVYLEFLASWHSYEETRTRTPRNQKEFEKAELQFQRSFNALSLIAPEEVHAAAAKPQQVCVMERTGHPAAFGRQRERTSAKGGPGGVGCSEDRKLTMLGLRERVIAAICEEEWPHPDNEVNSTTIYERLKREGDDASEAEVRQVLFQLSEHGDVTLVLEPGRGSGPVVYAVDPELCPQLHPDAPGAQEGVQRPWWRRMLGG